jgi:ParB-like nuclease family protein
MVLLRRRERLLDILDESDCVKALMSDRTSNPSFLLGSPETVPIGRLTQSDSPRLNGIDMAHVHTLADSDVALPPIIVHKSTMCVIDGTHRLRVAELRRQKEIEVRFFAGTERDAFVLAVNANIAHGLPLSLADRTAAAARIVISHPEWSDRAIGAVAGLAHRTVGHIRRRATGGKSQLHGRIGRDGRVRPLCSAAGRRIAGELMISDPAISLRKVASVAGISPGTARDVRNRLNRGEDPVLPKRCRTESRPQPKSEQPDIADRGEPSGLVRRKDIRPILHTLRKDPALRFNDAGRALLRLLDTYTILTKGCDLLVQKIPMHCASLVAEVADEYAAAWRRLGEKLHQRARESA